ncbi:MAG: NAD(P)/FAD-dependent oxidoreductase [Thermoplasmataceae archaeon]
MAADENDIRELDRLINNGRKNGVDDLVMLDRKDVISMEPNVTALRAIFSPSTGIIEPEDLMVFFRSKAANNVASFVTDTIVTRIVKNARGYLVSGRSSGQEFTILADTVINSAGLYSDRVAEMIGIDIDSMGYRLHLCKGDYFRLAGRPPVKSLVYPVPNGPGLGIHLTPDMAGSVKLGPNAYYSDHIDYKVESDPLTFREDVMKFLPLISNRELLVDSSGIRPKLDGPGEGFRDFIIRHEEDIGLPGFIDLIGIESPGLTASPAIGEYVSEIYENEIKH